MQTIKVTRITTDSSLPTRKHINDAGMDLYASEGASINANESMVIGTGVRIEIPEGYVGLIWPKSRDRFLIGAGVVDAGYQGEILVRIVNPSLGVLQIRQGEAIAQLLVMPVVTPEIVEVDEEVVLGEKTARGATGGIVSGKSLLGFLKEDEALNSVLLDRDHNMSTHSEEESLI